MDPVTHTLVGASLAATPLGERTRFAAPALVIGANLPDVDVLSFLGGGDFALGFRRGWTHGIPALAVLPALLAVVLLAWARLRRHESDAPPLEVGWLLGLCYLATLTHPFLDWLNTYGMRWWMPFRDTWTYGDSVFIVDPWLWLLLGSGWILARQASRGSHGFSSGVAAMVGLVASALFIVSMLVLHRVTEQRVLEQLAELDPTPIAALMVGPVPANPTAWEFVFEQGGRLRHGRFSWLGDRSLRFSDFDQPVASASGLWPRVEASGQARGFLTWVRFPWLEVDSGDSGTRVSVMDARYTRARTRGFGGSEVLLPTTRAEGRSATPP
jgi:inner membrane protein